MPEAPLPLDDAEPWEPMLPAQPSLGRRAFWTTTLFISVVAIFALHAAAFAIIYFAVKGDAEEPAQPGNQVAQALEKAKPPATPRPQKTRVAVEPLPEMPEPVPREDPGLKPERPVVPQPPVALPNEIEVAPEPRIASPIAPMPRLAIRLRVPDRPGWASEWDRNGDVQVRIRAVSLAALPIINVDKERSYTADKHLVFWLEIQNVSDRPHTYRRWQPVTSGECTLYSPSGAAMPIVIFPNQHRFDWTEDYERKLEPGADPLIETVFFSTPQDVASQHVLQLKAGHVGEKYLFTFKVPGNVPGK